jgi:crossover junction endodeoxyribonuclease RusA
MVSELLTLPWPPKELSPNARVHRMVKARVAKVYRTACWALAKGHKPEPALKMHIKLTFYPPNRQARDLDNCLAAVKSGLDGVADAWGINDRAFRPITIDMAEDVGGMVVVELLGD